MATSHARTDITLVSREPNDQIKYQLLMVLVHTGVLQKHKWENAMTVDRYSWGYRREANMSDILSPLELLTELVKTVRLERQQHDTVSVCMYELGVLNPVLGLRHYTIKHLRT